jgi:hypothetical protein
MMAIEKFTACSDDFATLLWLHGPETYCACSPEFACECFIHFFLLYLSFIEDLELSACWYWYIFDD